MLPLSWQKCLAVQLISLYDFPGPRTVTERTAFNQGFIDRYGRDSGACEAFWGPFIIDIGTHEVHAVEGNVQALTCPREKLWLERYPVITFRMIRGKGTAARRELSNEDAITIPVPFV